MNFDLKNFINTYRFYSVTLLLLIIWVLFLDKNSFLSQSKMRSELAEYENGIKHYEEQLLIIEKEQQEIMSSDDALEKYGREKYLMKKEGETVFVLVKQKTEINSNK